MVEAGGRLGPAAKKKFIDEVWQCDLSKVARNAAESSGEQDSEHEIVRAIGIEVMHTQAHRLATLIQELRNEEQFMADFTHCVV